MLQVGIIGRLVTSPLLLLLTCLKSRPALLCFRLIKSR